MKFLYALVSLSIISFFRHVFVLSKASGGKLRKTINTWISASDDSLDLLSSSSSYTEEAKSDYISSLPGLSFKPQFKQFSGYIPVSPTRKIHYWYIESSSDPNNDPVVFWTNGGPGCSGLLGLGTEFGPFIFEKDGVLTENPNSWNKIANILYVEQPAGVGFSTFDSEDDKFVDDNRAAVDNYALIVEFFKRFPERLGNDFYIASESFGGHYIPHLAKEILDKNDGTIQFRGFLVGNPYVDPFSNDVTMIQTYYMHGLIALPLFSAWEQQCTDPEQYDENTCDSLVDAMFTEAGTGINPYALDFPTCTEPDSSDYPPTLEAHVNSMGVLSTSSIARRRGLSSQSSITSSLSNLPPFLPDLDVYHPCAESHLYHYLNRDDVKTALHVETDKNWTMCTDDIEYSNDDRNKPQMYLYKDLIKRAMHHGNNLKMMIFSGDDDSSK